MSCPFIPRLVASCPYVQRLKTFSSIREEPMKYMLYIFFCLLSQKKVSKHLCRYVIGLDWMYEIGTLCQLCRVSSCSGVFFFFSLQHHDFFWQDMCQSSFCLSMSFSSSFFSMLLVFLGWSASWLYFSSHSFTRYCSFCALLLGQSLPCMLKLMLVRMQRLFRGCTGRTLSLMLRNICEG